MIPHKFEKDQVALGSLELLRLTIYKNRSLSTLVMKDIFFKSSPIHLETLHMIV